MYKVTYEETAKVSVTMGFKPEEFLNCNSEEEVCSVINSIISAFDYPDFDKVSVESMTLNIPEKFFTDWYTLKSKSNGIQDNK